MLPSLGLCLLGLAVGALGTLIGAGGGFLLAPMLTLLYPSDRPETLASISLAVVFANSSIGALAYARMKRIAYREGLIFASAGIPGALLGVWLSGQIARGLFELVLGATMVTGAILLILRPRPASAARHGTINEGSSETASTTAHNNATPGGLIPRWNRRDWSIGIAGSAGVGVLSSLLGIGGGIIHVPLLTLRLRIPVHVATATSHFILAITSGVGLAAHGAGGSYATGAYRAILLCAGAMVGAPIGASLSTRLHGSIILRGLAVALMAVGIRMAWIGLALLK